jgi:hypothetical protein
MQIPLIRFAHPRLMARANTPLGMTILSAAPYLLSASICVIRGKVLQRLVRDRSRLLRHVLFRFHDLR